MNVNSFQYKIANLSDERALVYGAAKFGYVFESRTPNYVQIKAFNKPERYDILNVIEFTSARKRMSVIIRDPEGKIKLFCKGADTMIYERLDNNNEELKENLLLQLEHFATEGLRTLCYATVQLSENEYNDWKQKYHEAVCSLDDREEKIEDAAELIERKLKLIGATAIEDKLQEGVPETIESLLKADINVWVLTGDKQETAINIGYSCRLLVNGIQMIILNQDSLDVRIIYRYINNYTKTIKFCKTEIFRELAKQFYTRMVCWAIC